MTGTVKWFNGKKGYGFISDKDGNDLFFHFSALQMDGYKTIDQGKRIISEKVFDQLSDIIQSESSESESLTCSFRRIIQLIKVKQLIGELVQMRTESGSKSSPESGFHRSGDFVIKIF